MRQGLGLMCVTLLPKGDKFLQQGDIALLAIINPIQCLVVHMQYCM